MKTLFLTLALGLSMTSVAVAQQTGAAKGEVVSVRLVARTFTVRDERAREAIRYAVPLGTPVTIAGGKARLGHLRAGDKVNVTYEKTDEGRKATGIAVPNANPDLAVRAQDGLYSSITGRVDALNFGQRTMTVIGDQTGERYSYAIPRDTRITIAGDGARFGNLRRGDDVVLRFKMEDGQRQAARVRVPDPVTPLARRPVQTAPAAMLPKTASAIPLIALLGLGAFLAAAGMRVTARFRSRR